MAVLRGAFKAVAGKGWVAQRGLGLIIAMRGGTGARAEMHMGQCYHARQRDNKAALGSARVCVCVCVSEIH